MISLLVLLKDDTFPHKFPLKESGKDFFQFRKGPSIKDIEFQKKIYIRNEFPLLKTPFINLHRF